MILIIVFGLFILLLILNLIRELFTLRDIKSNFYCSNCGTFHDEISNNSNCKKCHRRFNINGNTWDHLILHRVNWIPSKSSNEVFKWKDYKKISIIEITVNILLIVILVINILINYIK